MVCPRKSLAYLFDRYRAGSYFYEDQYLRHCRYRKLIRAEDAT